MPNVFTEKIGPLPTWAWMGIATAGILVVVGIKGKKGSQNNTAAQQQLAAEEAALANAAGQSSIAANNGASSYGSGYGRYSGNGGYTAGGYSMAPAQSSTMPSGSGQGTAPSPTPSPSNTVTVPNVVGTDAGNAHNILVAAGLKPTAPPGQRSYEIVASTTPSAGSQVSPGSSVMINTAYQGALPVQASTSANTAGPGQTVVPNCAGQSAGNAHNMIVAAGLVPTAASGQKATAKCKGTSPGAGSVVKRGSKVTILT